MINKHQGIRGLLIISVIFFCFAVFIFGIESQPETEVADVEISEGDVNTNSNFSSNSTMGGTSEEYSLNQDKVFSITVKKIFICTFDAFVWSLFTIWKIICLLDLRIGKEN